MSDIIKSYKVDLQNVFNHLEKTAENTGFYSPTRQKVCTEIWESKNPTLLKLEKAVKFLKRRFQEQGMDKYLEDSVCKKVFENSLWKSRCPQDKEVLSNGEEIHYQLKNKDSIKK